MPRIKKYNDTASNYADKLRKHGYIVRFNWVEQGGPHYDDVTVLGRNANCEFDTPRKAYEQLVQRNRY